MEQLKKMEGTFGDYIKTQGSVIFKKESSSSTPEAEQYWMHTRKT